jgi:ABC-2 type transport system ATP-binding protein
MQRHPIETCGLTRRFGERLTVDGLNLLALEAEVYGVLGPNGAGKTTRIRMLLGLIRPDAGEISLFDACINDYICVVV